MATLPRLECRRAKPWSSRVCARSSLVHIHHLHVRQNFETPYWRLFVSTTIRCRPPLQWHSTACPRLPHLPHFLRPRLQQYLRERRRAKSEKGPRSGLGKLEKPLSIKKFGNFIMRPSILALTAPRRQFGRVSARLSSKSMRSPLLRTPTRTTSSLSTILTRRTIGCIMGPCSQESARRSNYKLFVYLAL